MNFIIKTLVAFGILYIANFFIELWIMFGQVLILVQTHFGKLEKCPNCGNVLNYDNDNIAICTCDDYNYHYRA